MEEKYCYNCTINLKELVEYEYDDSYQDSYYCPFCNNTVPVSLNDLKKYIEQDIAKLKKTLSMVEELIQPVEKNLCADCIKLNVCEIKSDNTDECIYYMRI